MTEQRLTHVELMSKKLEESLSSEELMPDEKALLDDYRKLAKKDKLKMRKLFALMIEGMVGP